MWCDGFEGDLLKVIPGAAEAIGQAGDIELWTYCENPDGSKLNHPCAWNTDIGLAAFFGFSSQGFKPEAYYTEAPLVRCNFVEACRDLWLHHLIMLVENRVVIDFCNELRPTSLLLTLDAKQPTLLPANRQLKQEMVRQALKFAGMKLLRYHMERSSL